MSVFVPYHPQQRAGLIANRHHADQIPPVLTVESSKARFGLLGLSRLEDAPPRVEQSRPIIVMNVETEEGMQGSTHGEQAETTGCGGDGIELQDAMRRHDVAPFKSIFVTSIARRRDASQLPRR